MNSFEREMQRAANEYADVLRALTDRGHKIEFTQTGGMCFAIMVALDEATYALITDREEPLAAFRSHHRGWSIGTYEVQDSSDAVRLESTDDSTLDGLLILGASVLGRAGPQ